MKILYLIPARAGSKGLPGKNTKYLGEKPLVTYSIEFALNHLQSGDELCISTDDNGVLDIAKNMGVKIPFLRPLELATDTASTYDVLIHAINHYKNIDKNFDVLLLLQPTSPFRARNDLMEMISLYDQELDMVVSVKKAKENPYFTLFEEEENGLLIKSKSQNFERRQDCPDVFAFNGSMYLININSLLKMKISEFKKIKKLVMPEERSLDIDTLADWTLAEFYLNQQ
jgi:CMP-N,N'-diacetyllegionaminic acid synthase